MRVIDDTTTILIGTVLAASSTMFLSASTAVAFHTGAGKCPKGKFAVDSLHLDGDYFSGSLDDASLLVVTLDGQVLLPTLSSIHNESEDNHPLLQVPTDQDIRVRMERVDAKAFRGLLFRLGPGDNDSNTIGTLSEDSLQLHTARVCHDDYGVDGITHTNDNRKHFVEFTMHLTEDDPRMTIDVTIVEEFKPSIFYYGQYIIDAVAPAPSPSPTTWTRSSSMSPSSSLLPTEVAITNNKERSAYPSVPVPAPAPLAIPSFRPVSARTTAFPTTRHHPALTSPTPQPTPAIAASPTTIADGTFSSGSHRWDQWMMSIDVPSMIAMVVAISSFSLLWNL